MGTTKQQTSAITTAAAPMMFLRVTRGNRVKEEPIATLNEASAIWNAYRDSHGVRSSTMPRVDIVGRRRAPRARVVQR